MAMRLWPSIRGSKSVFTTQEEESEAYAGDFASQTDLPSIFTQSLHKQLHRVSCRIDLGIVDAAVVERDSPDYSWYEEKA